MLEKQIFYMHLDMCSIKIFGKQNILDSDFHNKQLDKPIEIVVTIDISDTADSDCEKLRAILKGALLSQHRKVYIKLLAEYSEAEMIALPISIVGR